MLTSQFSECRSFANRCRRAGYPAVRPFAKTSSDSLRSCPSPKPRPTRVVTIQAFVTGPGTARASCAADPTQDSRYPRAIGPAQGKELEVGRERLTEGQCRAYRGGGGGRGEG